MGRHTKTVQLIEAARDILAAHHPMTVRQVYYQLVSRQVIKNNKTQYQAVSKAIVNARREGMIPWDWIEDRLRQPRTVSMWDGRTDFVETCKRAYRRDMWETQPAYVEVWLEKDALKATPRRHHRSSSRPSRRNGRRTPSRSTHHCRRQVSAGLASIDVWSLCFDH